MKKIYLLTSFALCMFAAFNAMSQGIYQYWGVGGTGGADDQGGLYTTRMDGGGIKMRPAFTVATPGRPGAGTAGVVYNNKVYTIAAGGINSNGTILAYDPAANTYEVVYNFYSLNTDVSSGNLVVYNNKMYGIHRGNALSGDYGFIFEFNPATKTAIRKFEFTMNGYNTPFASLMLWGDELWGTTFNSPNFYGGIYSYDLGSGVYTERQEFSEFLGHRANCLLAVFNNKIYGTAEVGGANDKGTLFEYNPATDIYTVRAVFSGGNNGNMPLNGLTLFNNKFYGQTSEEGANGLGTLFEFDPVNNLFATKIQYTDVVASKRKNGFTVYNSKLYCTHPYSGTNNDGTIFEYDPATNALVKKVDLAGGSDPLCDLTLYNGKLYGICGGGPYDNVDGGSIFEYDPGGNSFDRKIHLRENMGVSPMGGPIYHNGKIYGVTQSGGTYGDGVLWEYDMATHVYSIRHEFNGTPATFTQGLTLYNGKLYGVSESGGTFGSGTLFSFDPATSAFTILHSFDEDNDGSAPRGRLLVYNNKLYGTCGFSGGANSWGTIWEYTPASNSFALKVKMPESVGKFPIPGLTELNGKLYGVCFQGGADDAGTLFEYNPAINGIMKKLDFSTNGGDGFPMGSMIVANNKLYGMTTIGDHLYEYNPANNNFAFKANLNDIDGFDPQATLVFNEETQKMYGTTWIGGTGGGIIFEYDLANNILARTENLTPFTGDAPRHMTLGKAPALVAPGAPGTCIPSGSANIDAGNNSKWIPFFNSNGDAVAEINANGNNLGRVLVNLYVHDGATRQKNGSYYLDRNITITVDNQPSSPVSVRLYIRKTEFEKLKNTPGSGINNIGALSVFKNDDACSNTMNGSASKLVTNITSWGGDYVFITSVNSFSTFYFASSSAVLPVDLLSFKGTKEVNSNKLQWEASCTNDVDFTLERSTTGSNFQSIALIMAQQQDCGTPFIYTDQNPPMKAYYRLKMTEQNGPVKYSNIILLDRNGKDNFTVGIFPNPVVGTQANLQINSAKKMSVPFTISDAMGRVVMQKEVTVQAGVNSYAIPVHTLSPGVYQLVYNDGEKNNVVRFVRQ